MVETIQAFGMWAGIAVIGLFMLWIALRIGSKAILKSISESKEDRNRERFNNNDHQ